MQTSALVLSLYGNDTDTVLRRLSGSPELQLRYLKEMLRNAEHKAARHDSDDDLAFGSGQPRAHTRVTVTIADCSVLIENGI